MRTRLLDRGALTDPQRCPACTSRLTGPRCSECGVVLSGEDGAAVWRLSLEAAAVLDRRDALLDRLQAKAAVAATRPAASEELRAIGPTSSDATAAARATSEELRAIAPTSSDATGVGGRLTPPSPPVVPPQRGTRPVPPHRGFGVQGLLVALGALLLAVAAVVFLVVSWDRLGLTGRAIVIGAGTVAVLAAAAGLRARRLGATAEAVGSVGVVMVLLDAWAVRATGLVPASLIGRWLYTAVAATVVTALLAVWGRLARLRCGTVAAAVLAPTVPVALGLHAGDLVTSAAPADGSQDTVRALAALSCVAAGLAGAVLVGAARRRLSGLEGVVLTVWSVAAAVGSAGLALTVGLAQVVERDQAGAALALLALAAAAVVQPRDAVWRTAAGAATATAAALGAAGALRAAAPAGASSWWSSSALLLVPLLAAALVTLVLAAAGRRTPRVGPAEVRGALVVAAALVLPALVVAVEALLAVLGTSGSTWRSAPGTPLGTVTWSAGPDLVADGPRRTAVLALLVAAAAAVAVARLQRRADAAAAVPVLAAAAPLTAVALLVAPLEASWPLLVVLAVLTALAGLATGVLALPPGRPVRHLAPPRWDGTAGTAARMSTWLVAVAALGAAVLLAWRSEALTVPWLALAALALLAARRPAGRPVRPLLLAGAVATTSVAAAALATSADLSTAAAATWAAVPALLAATGLALVPPARARDEDRAAAGLTAAAAVLVAVPLVAPEHGPRLALAAVVAAALAAAALAPRAAGRVGEVPAAALTGAAVVAAALAAGLIPTTPEAVPAAAVVALVGVLTAVASVRAPADLRRVGGELGAAAAGTLTLALAGAGTLARLRGASYSWVPTREGDDLWIVLLLVGAGAAAVAGAPDRHRVGWVAGVLLTASSWTRLAQSDVRLVEAYTLPPAAALACVALLRDRADRADRAASAASAAARAAGEAPAEPDPALWWRRHGSWLALAIVPSVIASGTGPLWRPVTLLVVAVLVLLAAVTRRHERLLALGTGIAAATALWRAAHDLTATPPGVPERWTAPAALAVLAVVPAWRAASAHGRKVAHVAALVAVGLLVVPTALADLVGAPPAGYAGLRSGLLLLGGIVLAALAVALRTGPTWRRVGAGTAATGAAVGALVGPGPLELWTVPLAALLLLLGEDQRRVTGQNSWRHLSAGLALGLLPSLVLTLESSSSARVVLLTVGGLAVLAWGVLGRLQAPFVSAVLVLAVLAVVQLGPTVMELYDALPRWVTLGAAGVLLLVVGATYEARLRDLRTVRRRVADLR